MGKILPVEEDDGVGGRGFLEKGLARSYLARTRPGGIVHLPGLAGKLGRVRVSALVVTRFFRLRREIGEHRGHGQEDDKAFHRKLQKLRLSWSDANFDSSTFPDCGSRD